ncbi:MAG TPA: peptidase [Frankiaceae bacterium]|nr:peptidase [Frankiaceae bacterium]
MRKALALFVLMAGTLVPAIGASAQVESGGVGIRLLEAPKARQDDPRAHRSIVDHVKPGATFSRRFEVSNTTDGQRLIAIYAAAADVVGGEFRPADGRTPNELSEWITVSNGNADLGPAAVLQTQLTISVPANASEGERYAVVWAELPPSTPPAGGVAVVNRVGLRVYLSVGPGGEPKSDFVIESLTAERDVVRRPVVRASVRNTGGRALDLAGKLQLSNGPGGLSAGPFDAKVGTTLAIGATAPVTIQLDPALPDGPWLARIELQSGKTVRVAEAPITFPSGAGIAQAPVTAEPVDDGGGSTLPINVAALLLLIGLGALLGWLFRRRRDRPEPEPEPEPLEPAVPLDDVLAELRTAEGPRRDELMAMATAYGKDAILASPNLATLPVQTARELGERVARAGR